MEVLSLLFSPFSGSIFPQYPVHSPVHLITQENRQSIADHLLEGSEYRGLPHTGMPVQGNHRSLRLPVRQRIKNPTPISLVSSFHLPGPDSDQSKKQDHIATTLPAPPAHHYQITAPLGKGFNRPEIERQTTADRIHSPEPRLSGSLLLVGNTYFRTLTIIQQG